LQLDDFILYLDENLDNCQPILEALIVHNIQYRRHRDSFPRGTADEIWLPFVADRGWIVLTKDKRNRYNEIERDAVRRHRVREFYFGSGNFSGADMAEALLAAVPQMKNLSRFHSAPFCWKHCALRACGDRVRRTWFNSREAEEEHRSQVAIHPWEA